VSALVQLCPPVCSQATVVALGPVVDALAASLAADPDAAAALERSGWEPHQAALGHVLDLLCTQPTTITVDGVDYTVAAGP
jgi:hypothetical protein